MFYFYGYIQSSRDSQAARQDYFFETLWPQVKKNFDFSTYHRRNKHTTFNDCFLTKIARIRILILVQFPFVNQKLTMIFLK